MLEIPIVFLESLLYKNLVMVQNSLSNKLQKKARLTEMILLMQTIK